MLTIALAVVKGGAARGGETVYAWSGGRVTPARIVSSVFVDPQGERQHV